MTLTNAITGRPDAIPLRPGLTTSSSSSAESEAFTSARPCASTVASIANATGQLV